MLGNASTGVGTRSLWFTNTMLSGDARTADDDALERLCRVDLHIFIVNSVGRGHVDSSARGGCCGVATWGLKVVIIFSRRVDNRTASSGRLRRDRMDVMTWGRG